ncbi:histidine kinase-like protein [Actinomadura pelletieri DSM 43383]|uniref:Histidine kinase-like protein n=1 Tax=Actinomadura pelletieri DSM 43383 TaxID=1120940 RepID=A0A495R0L3_9ACTN|nr:ATP-binding protein [Actinomadura pelletieri]RKS79822.1 histidine kinase-like protein [Actinomadura pelletieri DSM 43383]
MVAKVVQVGELDISCRAAGTVPGMVRSLVGFRLADWGLERVAGDVLLVAGELVANAVQSAPDREIRVKFTRDVGAVVVAVWDPGDGMPVARPVVEVTLDDIRGDALALEEGGRGLQIVQALASGCGVKATPPVGKWVWAAVAC